MFSNLASGIWRMMCNKKCSNFSQHFQRRQDFFCLEHILIHILARQLEVFHWSCLAFSFSINILTIAVHGDVKIQYVPACQKSLCLQRIIAIHCPWHSVVGSLLTYKYHNKRNLKMVFAKVTLAFSKPRLLTFCENEKPFFCKLV